MTTTIREFLWLRWLLKDLEATPMDPTPFYDNQGACHIVNNPVFHERTNILEIGVQCHN